MGHSQKMHDQFYSASVETRTTRLTDFKIAGFFPGLGSRAFYQNLSPALLDSGVPEVSEIYQESARVLGFPGRPENLLMAEHSLPAGKMAKPGYIGAALLVHSLALDAHMRAMSAQREMPMHVVAYTGESFGIIAAAVASGALSVGDGVKIGQAFTPLMLVAADGFAPDDPFARQLTSYFQDPAHVSPLVTEPYHVIGLRGRRPEMIAEILEIIDKTFSRSDVEVHKLYSVRQVNVYVRAGAKSSFDRFVGIFPAMETEELKPPTTFLAHSERMRVARRALERFIDDTGIVFCKPHTPVVSNHNVGVLTTAADVRNGILAATDKIMTSRTTVETLKRLHPVVIVELGLGGKSLQLLMDNDVDIPSMAYTGTVEQTDHLLHSAKPPAISPAADDGRVLGHDRHGAAVHRYLNPGEKVVGFGEGGSESLTMFIRKAGEDEMTVRKVLSEALLTTRWSRRGEGVMLPPFAKARKQFEYLRALPDTIRHYFPQAYDMQEREIDVPAHLRKPGQNTYKEVIYEMSYLPGKELSQFIGTHSPAAPIIARIYEQILVTLNRDVHTVNRVRAPGSTLESSYFSKIEGRLGLCRRTAPLIFGANLTDTELISINGTSYLNSSALLKRFRRHREFHEILEPRFHALVVGDTNTENIKVTNSEPILDAQRLIESGARRVEIDAALNAITSESIGIKFLDPRSIGFNSDGAHTRDDPMYDTKIWHNSIGHYDEIHHEYFDIEVEAPGGKIPRINIEFNQGNRYRRAYQGVENYFSQVMQSIYGSDELESESFREDPHWLVRFVFVMGTHFLAMPPFHFQSEPDDKVVADSYHVQRRPVALYCEGIQWLNWALEILEGRRQEFMGVEVPPLPYAISSLVA